VVVAHRSLQRSEAVERFAVLAPTAYDVSLDLAADTGTFTSRTVLDLRSGSGTTFLDLKPVRLSSIRLDGHELDTAGLRDGRFPLDLTEGEHRLEVEAVMPFRNDGEGLHRATDPVDGRDYVYGMSFMSAAPSIFACFDQPDLKAPYTLHVTAPEDWLVLANASGEHVGDGRWEFAPSRPLSTYFVTLVAGPYHRVEDQHDGIPLGLLSRQSLAGALDQDAPELLTLTRQCFDEFHRLFGIRYPFGKYDQAFVPEFNAGAMENPGLVTFRDEYVFRSAITDAERQERAEVIAHEMAHMWFGDLVTMRWWDDLWLNESFAEYMGYRVVTEATRFSGAWTEFAVGRKWWGYGADQRPSTHPVAPESVPDAGMALLNFDGISYAKGASVLRQLAEWIGDEAFLAGLRHHFGQHAHGNATLDDLLSSLSIASHRDLRDWAQRWLRTSQVNTLLPHVSVGADGAYSSVVIEQTAPPEQPTLRPHRLGVGVYSGGTRSHRVRVDLDPDADAGRTPVPELIGVEAGDLLLLNDGDLTYAKVRLDDASRPELPRVLPSLTDPLARALVWGAVVDAVRDAETPATDLVALCATALPSESELTVFRDVVTFATGVAVDQYLPPSAQPAARTALGRACMQALDAAEPGGDRQLVAARGFVASAGEADADRLRGWLDGSTTPSGLRMDEEMRWLVLARLAALGRVDEADIDAEYERDTSAQGAEYAAQCRASRPDAAAKADAWRLIVDDDTASNRILESTATGFWQPWQGELTRPYLARYFDEMPTMAARRSQLMVYLAAWRAFPRYAVEPETVEACERLIAAPDCHPVLRRCVIDLADDMRRALAARRHGIPDAAAG
jgi:aminopeptidase N